MTRISSMLIKSGAALLLLWSLETAHPQTSTVATCVNATATVPDTVYCDTCCNNSSVNGNADFTVESTNGFSDVHSSQPTCGGMFAGRQCTGDGNCSGSLGTSYSVDGDPGCCPAQGSKCQGGKCCGPLQCTAAGICDICANTGSSCSQASDCCSGQCYGGKCADCVANGGFCLDDSDCCSGSCSANYTCQSTDSGECDPNYGSVCDDCGDMTACDGSCPGADTCDAGGGGGGGGGDDGSGCVGDYNCGYDEYCDFDRYPYECELADPIIIDLTGDGFTMTSAQAGVNFNFFGDGRQHQVAWTAAGANIGWLALDLNGDGAIQNAKELFSNVSPQPDSKQKLGFLALAVYDDPANGGNHNGAIDQQDAVFSQLRVWVDKNHNGVSDPGELLTMQQAGIESISLHYDNARWTDAYGNIFRYRSKIAFTGGKDKNDRYAYDVILTGVK